MDCTRRCIAIVYRVVFVDLVISEAATVNGAAASDELAAVGSQGSSNSNANNKNKKKKKGGKVDAQKADSVSKLAVISAAPSQLGDKPAASAQLPSTAKRNKVTATASESKVKVASSQVESKSSRSSSSNNNSAATTPRNKIQSSRGVTSSTAISSADKRLVDRNNSRNKEQSGPSPKAATVQSGDGKKAFGTAMGSTGARRLIAASQ